MLDVYQAAADKRAGIHPANGDEVIHDVNTHDYMGTPTHVFGGQLTDIES